MRMWVAVLTVSVCGCDDSGAGVGQPDSGFLPDTPDTPDVEASDVYDTTDVPAVDAVRTDAAVVPDWLESGANTSCVSRSGRVWCWGTSFGGRSLWTTPYEVVELAGARQLAIGLLHSCAVFSDGHVLCVGSNRVGQLGVDSLIDPGVFVTVPGVAEVAEVSVGADFSCVRQRTGRVSCWGQNAQGQTGSPIPSHPAGSSVAQSKAAAVEGILDAVSIAAGNAHTCVVLSDGTVRCWGSDAWGALGRGAGYTGGPEPIPGKVEGLTGVKGLTLGRCALRADGSVWCWGTGVTVFPGYDPKSVDNCPVVVDQPCWRAPRPLRGISGAKTLEFGGSFGCVEIASSWQCWGEDDYGQATGDGSILDSISELSTGFRHLCVSGRDGVVSCRGRGDSGQLGDGRSSNSRAFVKVALPKR